MTFRYQKLDQVIEEIATRWEIPGLGVGIIHGGELAFTRCMGVQNLATCMPVTQDTIFCLASISKCLVSSAVMQLKEQGKIDLDIPLVHYLPFFRLEDDRYPHITIRQVLNHTSGLPDMDEFKYIEFVTHPETDDGTAERYVRGLGSSKLMHEPGEKFYYSNIGYNILGDLIAKLSKSTFEETMQRNILAPAGMTGSSFLLADINRERLAMPHIRAPGMRVFPTYPYHRADAPASFLHSTLVDMCRWALTCLERGLHQGKRILTPASYKLMWTPSAKRDSPPFREDMGLGWNLGHFEGVRTISHGGAGFGWSCFLILLPDKGSAAIVMTNQESSATDRISSAVVRTMLGLEPVVGKVSWMVPFSHALQAGGMKAARSFWIMSNNNLDQEYIYNHYELIGLVYELMAVGNIDLALEVLDLNLQAFPRSVDTHTYLAKLYIQKKQFSKARTLLEKALAIEPQNNEVLYLVEELQKVF